jgi:hypothetical protein
MYLAVEDGRIGILPFIEMQEVGMNQIDTGVLRLGFPYRTLLLFLSKGGD